MAGFPALLLAALFVAVLLSAVGTRLAAVFFVISAVWMAGSGGVVVGFVGGLGAATAAGLVLTGSAPRRLALPAAGVGAVLIAVSATNAAAVLPAWTLAAACAVAVGGTTAGTCRRWSATLLASDLVVIGAVCWVVLDRGFWAWGSSIPDGAAALLLVAAATRVPLAAGLGGKMTEAGLIVVRAQVVALGVVALSADAAWFPAVAAATGSAGFLVGGLQAKEESRDTLQEMGAFALVLAGVAGGWLPIAWLWVPLVAGTLIHLVRVARPRGTQVARTARTLVRSGTLLSPLAPVVSVGAFAGVVEGGIAGALVLCALASGLALRLRGHAPDRARGGAVPAVGLTLAGLAVLTALWVPVAVRAAIPTAEAVWPPTWAVVLVVGAVVLGGLFARSLAPARPRRLPEVDVEVPLRRQTRAVARAIEAAAPGVAVPAGLGCLALGSAAVWVLGWSRGFL